MYHFLFEAHPKPDTEAAKSCGGAFVNCWIDFRDQWGADQLARILIENEGWVIDKCVEVKSPDREDYESSDLRESLELFDEALANGWSCVFNCWRHDAPDASVEY